MACGQEDVQISSKIMMFDTRLSWMPQAVVMAVRGMVYRCPAPVGHLVGVLLSWWSGRRQVSPRVAQWE